MLVTIFGNTIAYGLATLLGYIMLSLMLSSRKEGVFFRIEYWILSFLFGSIVVGISMFFLGILAIPMNIFTVSPLLSFLLLILFLLKKKQSGTFHFRERLVWDVNSLKGRLILGAIVFMVVKLLFGFADILSVPTYQDDTFGNWNMRAKVFYEREGLVLDSTDAEFLGMGYRQYPPIPSLFKTYIALFSSHWHEGAVNLPSFLYFLSALGLLFFIVYRLTESVGLGVLSSYIATAIPIFYIHGTNPYYDIFQSVYFLLAVYFGFLFLRREIHWSILAVAIGILGYTKSEGLVIYTTAILAGVFLIQWKKESFKRSILQSAKILSIVILMNLPFIVFKWYYGLGFGNGDAAVSDTTLSFHPEVFPALYRALFHFGNYNLFWFFFILVFLLFILKKGLRRIGSGEFIFLICGWIAFFLILGVYLTTFTYQYVLDQTGINRSMVQLLPVFLIQFIIFLHSIRHV